MFIELVQNQLYRIPSKRTESHNIQRLVVPLYRTSMALLGARPHPCFQSESGASILVATPTESVWETQLW
jgi:hypothetical protein